MAVTHLRAIFHETTQPSVRVADTSPSRDLNFVSSKL